MTSTDSPGFAGVFYDGASSVKHRVTVWPGEQFEIVEDDVLLASWAYGDVRRADGQKALRLYSVSDSPLARLDIDDEASARALIDLFPSLDAADRTQTGRIVGWSLAAIASIVLLILYGIPFAADRLTPHIPMALEKRLGEAVDGQVLALFDAQVCTGEDGRKAFAKLVEKVRVAGGAAPVQAEVLSSTVQNAISLPGGKIYLFDGMLQSANSPDEIAGVIGHEIGHSHHRHVLRTMIQTGGTSFLFGLLFGDITGSGAVVFVAQSLLDASHSREAETAADDFAVAAMTQLQRSPVPLGEFLTRLTGEKGKGTILDSHPVSSARLERIRQSDIPTTGPELLTDEEWRALKYICKPWVAHKTSINSGQWPPWRDKKPAP